MSLQRFNIGMFVFMRNERYFVPSKPNLQHKTESKLKVIHVYYVVVSIVWMSLKVDHNVVKRLF